MVRFINKFGMEFLVYSVFIEVDFTDLDGDGSDCIRYCVQGLCPGANTVPEVHTLAVYKKLDAAIKLAKQIRVCLEVE